VTHPQHKLYMEYASNRRPPFRGGLYLGGHRGASPWLQTMNCHWLTSAVWAQVREAMDLDNAGLLGIRSRLFATKYSGHRP